MLEDCEDYVYFYVGDFVWFFKWFNVMLSFDEEYEQWYWFFVYGDDQVVLEGIVSLYSEFNCYLIEILVQLD